MAPAREIAQLLEDVRDGDPTALNHLAAFLYPKLHRLARRQLLGQGRSHTLRATDLVHETYLKLANVEAPNWKNCTHFLAVASRAMRSILVDYARKRRCTKHGGARTRISLSDADILSDRLSAEVVAVDEALARLSELAPRKSQVVELRYFAGFSIEETAEVLAISIGTVKREWNMARAWLRRELGQRGPG